MYLCLLYNILKLTIAFLLAVSLRRYFELGRCYFCFTECRILFSSCLPCTYVPLDLGLKLSLLHLSTEASTSGQESRYTVGQLPVAFTSQWMGITTLHREITFSFHSPHWWFFPFDLLGFMLICVTWRHPVYTDLYPASISNTCVRWGHFNESQMSTFGIPVDTKERDYHGKCNP